ncbi:MAG: hypothetical protein QOK37_4389 [Thermoanaerobaculia bacterium]|jgi:uncharacterized protein (DUF1697 family)|nr:hypothetical protein [Thermoanaerobaculia bacterium]
MPAFICLLRGVNVGGNKMLKMESLKKLCLSLGLLDASTYLQSGNIVFRSDVTDRAVLVRRIEEGIRKATALDVRVILRTTAEMKKLIAANPMSVDDRNPKALLVAFLNGELSKGAKELLSGLKAPSEELHVAPRELYLYFPEGIAGSKLSNALTEKKVGVTVTARNWNTVNALLQMAEEMEGRS